MKKTIIAIAIAIMIAPLAFAVSLDDMHSARLKTNVGFVIPAFQFEFTSGMLESSSERLITNSGAEEFTDGKNYDEYATDIAAIDVADISQYGLNLLFTAKLANKAKCNSSYTLTFKAGGFDVYRNGIAGTLDTTDDPEISVASDINARLGLVVENAVPGKSVQVKFNGNECSEGDLVKFKVQYPADPSLDPTSEGMFYFANISLEISSDN